MKQLLAFLFFLIFASPCLIAQVDSVQQNALNVFLDCDMCDQDHVKKNITYINYVRDPKVADVHILVSTQNTGSGGNEYNVIFIGKNKFAGASDTLKFTTTPTSTNEETRADVVQVLQGGLMRFVAKTPQFKKINFEYTGNDSASENVKDKWNNWVYSISANGYFNGEKSYTNTNGWGSLEAKKVTPEYKIDFNASSSYSESVYEIDDTTTYRSMSHSEYFNQYYVKSINDHWSVGYDFDAHSSTYSNIKFKARVAPAIEYNIFKYSESTNHQLRLLYTISSSHSWYNDTTIYNKIDETLFAHSLKVAFEQIKTWGTINFTVSGSHYLHDATKNNLNAYGSVSIRLFKGLMLNFSGSVSLIHDQVALVKGDVSDTDVLLRQRQLETQYSYWLSGGLSYTFGSIYNNVVNPRFGY